MNNIAMLNNFEQLDYLIHTNLVSLVKTSFDDNIARMAVCSKLNATQYVWYLRVTVDNAYLDTLDKIVYVTITHEHINKSIMLNGNFSYGTGEYFLKFDEKTFDIERSENAADSDIVSFIKEFFNDSEKNLKMMIDRIKQRG